MQKTINSKFKKICFAVFCAVFITLVIFIIAYTKKNNAKEEPSDRSYQDVRIVSLSPQYILDKKERIKKEMEEQFCCSEESKGEECASPRLYEIPTYEETEIIYFDNQFEVDEYEDRYMVCFETETQEEQTTQDELKSDQDPESDGFEYFTLYNTPEGWERTLPASERTQRWVYKMCQKYDLPYRTVLAILGAETCWNEDPDHREKHGDQWYIGVACISEKWHAKNFADMGIDIYSLNGNIEAFCYLLRGFIDRFDGNVTYGIIGYNRGYTGAYNYIEDGNTTSAYTDKVFGYAESFH